MTWSYDPANLGTDPMTRVRLELGDTDSTDEQLQDEEIEYFLTAETDELLAAARGAEAIAAKYARQVTMSASGVSMQAETLMAHYKLLAEQLRNRAALNGVAPWAGGVYQSERDTDAIRTDLHKPDFFKGMEENPGSANPTQLPLS